MKAKRELTFGLLYFGLILFSNITFLFNFIWDNVDYGHYTYVFASIGKLSIFIIGIIILKLLYKKFNKNRKERKEPITIKKKITLYFIALIFITIVSLMSGWQLKPLSDLGEKYSALKIYDAIADIITLSVEIYLMTCILYHFDKFYCANFKSFKYFTPAIVGVLLTYSVYNLIMDFTVYQFIFIPFTALLGFIYPYCNRSIFITYVISVLVFLI